ncbi:hypothetical protein KV679_16945 [Bacillus sp. JRC01]|nr:hypothetical protein [Bacillus sp. JRC01]
MMRTTIFRTGLQRGEPNGCKLPISKDELTTSELRLRTGISPVVIDGETPLSKQ